MNLMVLAFSVAITSLVKWIDSYWVIHNFLSLLTCCAIISLCTYLITSRRCRGSFWLFGYSVIQLLVGFCYLGMMTVEFNPLFHWIFSEARYNLSSIMHAYEIAMLIAGVWNAYVAIRNWRNDDVESWLSSCSFSVYSQR